MHTHTKLVQASILFFRKYRYSIIWSIILLVLGLLPKSSLPDVRFHIPFLDKIAHAGFYFLLIFFILHESNKLLSNRLIINALSYCLVLGCSIELGQKYFLQGRSFEIWDIVANIIGSFIGILIYRILKPLL